MSNHVFNSESSEDMSYLYSDKDKYRGQVGGNQISDDQMSDNMNSENRADPSKPSGGFPPIFIIDIKDKDEEKSKNRQLAPPTKGISIKDILKGKK
jgi:hypothetical protein